MTSIFRAVVVIGLLSLCNAGSVLAAPVADKPAAGTEQKAPAKKSAPAKKGSGSQEETCGNKKTRTDSEQIQVCP